MKKLKTGTYIAIYFVYFCILMPIGVAFISIRDDISLPYIITDFIIFIIFAPLIMGGFYLESHINKNKKYIKDLEQEILWQKNTIQNLSKFYNYITEDGKYDITVNDEEYEDMDDEDMDDEEYEDAIK